VMRVDGTIDAKTRRITMRESFRLRPIRIPTALSRGCFQPTSRPLKLSGKAMWQAHRAT
jgi:hypothetical protein